MTHDDLYHLKYEVQYLYSLLMIQRDLVTHLQRMLKANKAEDLPARIEALQAQLKDANRQLADLTKASVSDAVGDLVATAQVIDGVKVISRKLSNTIY